MNHEQMKLIANFEKGKISLSYFSRRMAKIAIQKNRKFTPHTENRNERRFK